MGSGAGMKNMFRLSVLIVTVLACGQLPQKPAVVTDTPPVSLTGKGIIEVEPPGEPSFVWLVWSPDSEHLAAAYSRTSMGKFSLPSLYQIQILDINQRTLALLEESTQNVLWPQAWLPSNEVAYYTDRDPKGIWVVQVATKDKWFLIESDQAIWTLDGKKVIYKSSTENLSDNPVYYAIRDDSTRQDDLIYPLDIPNTIPFLMQWSQNDKQILFLLKGKLGSGPGMYIIDVDTKTQRQIGIEGFYGSASWSPDGKHIIYTYQKELGSDFRQELYVVNADGTCPTKILDGGDFDIATAFWSPDGKWIAFAWNGGIYLLDTSQIAEIELLKNDSSCP